MRRVHHGILAMGLLALPGFAHAHAGDAAPATDPRETPPAEVERLRETPPPDPLELELLLEAPPPPARARWVPLDLALTPELSLNRWAGGPAYNVLGLGLGATHARRLTGVQAAVGAPVADELLGVQLGGLSAVASRGGGVQAAGLVAAFTGDGSTVQLAGLVSALTGRGSALQAAGLVNAAGAGSRALQLTGGVNVMGARSGGVQAAGLVNAFADEGAGLQVAGLVNGVGGRLRGMQTAGVSNAAVHLQGLQLAGAANAVYEGDGLQLSAVWNYARERLAGAQLALINVAGRVQGAQLGLVNVARSVEGVQLGLVNVAEEIVSGAPVGLASWVSNGPRHVALWADETGPFHLGLQLGTHRIRSLVFAGAQPFRTPGRLSFGGGLAVHYDPGPRLWLEPEVTGRTVVYDYDFRRAKAWHGQLGLKVGWALSRYVSVFGGWSLNAAVSRESDLHELAPGPSRLFIRNDWNIRLWPGLLAGLRL